jgi:hypothetical protein
MGAGHFAQTRKMLAGLDWKLGQALLEEFNRAVREGLPVRDLPKAEETTLGLLRRLWFSQEA